jgi:putative lipoic acid-binding regulatory protein
MANLPPLELLRATHEFPTVYVFKVVGNADEGFLARVLSAARKAAALSVDPEFSVRQSSSGKHVAITLEIPTDTAERVLEIYRELSLLEGLAFLM